jgi:hypothetical protein
VSASIDRKTSLPGSSISCNFIESKTLPEPEVRAVERGKTFVLRDFASETLNRATPHVYGFV